MPDIKTEVTEIITGLAMLGYPSVEESLQARPGAMVNVESEHWDKLEAAWKGGELAPEFLGAWMNGVAFLKAEEGLRQRIPLRVEWKGPHRTPGYDLIPADLRVDHVFLVSCKYLSRILFNASPSHLFDRCLTQRQGGDGTDWYLEAAPQSYRDFYSEVRRSLAPDGLLPDRLEDLAREHRTWLKQQLTGSWPEELDLAYRAFCAAVSTASAARWNSNLRNLQAKEEMLWRLLRLASAPYFILGIMPKDVLRLRIHTPWDWRQEFRLQEFDIWGDGQAGQPMVRWRAAIKRLADGGESAVDGHVEVRWSHGRFCGNPEAKVYLDTPHQEVPGYAGLR